MLPKLKELLRKEKTDLPFGLLVIADFILVMIVMGYR